MSNKFSTAMVLFVLLSMFDLVMTLGVTVTDDTCEESNPIAVMVMSGGGNVGVVAFKLLTVLLVIMCIKRIADERPKLGKLVLNFGVLLLFMVALYHVSIVAAFAHEANILAENAKPNSVWVAEQERIILGLKSQ